mmetsp:Transcript_18172/g.27028  ORF Transcript_18172/g.27028 Transcript_18172/m.27028 type:complete len:208 (+) Transcript_18172:30-653(+)
MPKSKKPRRVSKLRIKSPNDERLNHIQKKNSNNNEKTTSGRSSSGGGGASSSTDLKYVHTNSSLFFRHNESLGPPYRVLLDTNFINFSVSNKLEIVQSMLDCLYAKCIPCITDCVIAELEKLGPKYRVALRIAKDPRFERIPCLHKGTYADDCLVRRVEMHKCYIVATNDKELRRRIRKIPGVPIMFVQNHKYDIERLPEANMMAPK